MTDSEEAKDGQTPVAPVQRRYIAYDLKMKNLQMQNNKKKAAVRRQGTQDRSATEKADAGKEIYESYLTRKSTFKWLKNKAVNFDQPNHEASRRKTESEELVSVEKMQLMVNQNHPRVVINGKLTKVPMCVGIGNFSAKSLSETQGFDHLGLGIS